MGVDAIVLVRVSREMTDKEIKRLSWRCMEALDSSHFYKQALNRVESRLDQEPEPGTTLLEAGVWSRHYGEGYERGDFVFLAMLAEWLEANTGGVVYYGTDHGDDSKPWREIAEPLKRYWFEHGHVPYSFREPEQARFRKLCPDCDEVMSQNGWGGPDVAFLHCVGCDLQMRTRDGGKTWAQEKSKPEPQIDMQAREAGLVIADWATESGHDHLDLYAAFLEMARRREKSGVEANRGGEE